ncbi:hypothetical protein [Streptomyces flaveolus]|uniref:hypothetical protein n=1 Tax=Streptomyces flaveolus TaxID=67297 RepID=UPI0019C76F61|nr:hypothetical protein [Streptomyces flaveolus]GGQ83660.1 hypothetical protein GCM10010216_51890 [Streptomyces flaveolus]
MPNPTAPTQQQPSPASTPWQVPWPAGTIARYWTVAGATADVTETKDGEFYQYNVKCTGCPHTDTSRIVDNAHRWAQAHAEKCRALPRPAAVQ